MIGSSAASRPAKGAGILVSQTDVTCKDQPAQDATGASGVVHLTGLDNGVFSGTFDLTVAETDASSNVTSTADHLTGSFRP